MIFNSLEYLKSKRTFNTQKRGNQVLTKKCWQRLYLAGSLKEACHLFQVAWDLLYFSKLDLSADVFASSKLIISNNYLLTLWEPVTNSHGSGPGLEGTNIWIQSPQH